MISENFHLINSFPSFTAPAFDMEHYNKKFSESNIVINAVAKTVHYPEHWGPLSIKTVIKGEEYYQLNSATYKVNPHNYLLLNEGTYYSSFIDSENSTESFTLNFTQQFLNDAVGSVVQDDVLNIDYENKLTRVEVIEKLYFFDPAIKKYLSQLKSLTQDFYNKPLEIEELHHCIIKRILLSQTSVRKELAAVKKQKFSTREELYKRLHRAKDHLDSCYHKNISIDELAQITFMNPSYFLRQFKSFFKITPRQYLINRRLETAYDMLQKGTYSVTEVCHEIGYQDISSFGKLFKQAYKKAPEEFRRKKIFV